MHRSSGRIPALVIFMVLGFSGLALSVPRFVASALKISGDVAFDDVRAGRTNAATLDTIIASRTQALKFVESGLSHRDIALAKMFTARQSQGDVSEFYRDAALAEARIAITESPGDGTAWLRLASAHAYKYGVNAEMIDMVMMSITTAPYETELLLERLEYLFLGRAFLKNEWDEQVDEQIRAAWHREARAMVPIIRRTGSLDIVRRALEKPPSMAQHLDGAIADPKIR